MSPGRGLIEDQLFLDIISRVAGRDCPLCGGPGEPMGVCDGYSLRECCGILLSWQWTSIENYHRWYEDPTAYHRDEQLRERQEPSLARDTDHLRAAHCRLSLIRELAPELHGLLDVGAGTGAFVAQASAFGFDARGVEPCESMVQHARRLGRNLQVSSWEDVAGEYDIITMNDVWEHLTAPVASLVHLRGCLSSAGLLIVELPEWRGRNASREQLTWRHVRPRQHLFLPSDEAARALFHLAGFEIEAAVRPLRGRLGKVTYFLSIP